MLEAWLIGGACAVVAFGLGLLVGTKTSEAYLEVAAMEAGRRVGALEAYRHAHSVAEDVQASISKRSPAARAIVARLRQLADADAGASLELGLPKP